MALLLATMTLGAPPARERLLFKDSLLFYASYDRTADADFARGAGRAVRTGRDAKSKAVRAPGKIGKALLFRNKGGTRFCEYKAAGNVLAKQGTMAFFFRPNWSGADKADRMASFFFRPGARSRSAGANFPDCMGVFARRYRKPYVELWVWCDDHGGGNNIARGSIADWRRGEWRHVAVTWDPNRLQIYIDGELRGRRRQRGLITEPDDRFFVGASRNGAFCSDGVLDEFYIYARALSAAEIGLLTGYPRLTKPRILSMRPQQTLYFRSDKAIRFQCELAGKIDPERHRIRAELIAGQEKAPVAASAFRWRSGTYAIPVDRLPERAYRLRIALADEKGSTLDRKLSEVHVVRGPFDR